MQDLIERIKKMEARSTPRRGLILIRLRDARVNSGISQKDFAKDVGVGYSTLRFYETCQRGPIGIDNAIQIARHLGLRLKDITSREALEEYASQSRLNGKVFSPMDAFDVASAEDSVPEKTTRKSLFGRLFRLFE